MAKIPFKIINSPSSYNVILDMKTQSLFILHLRPMTMEVSLPTSQGPIVIHTRPPVDATLSMNLVNTLERHQSNLTPFDFCM